MIADIALDVDAIEDVAFELENTSPPDVVESAALVAKLQEVSRSLRHTLAIMRAHMRDADAEAEAIVRTEKEIRT